MGDTTADTGSAAAATRPPKALSRDSVLEVLSNERRRHAMHCLKRAQRYGKRVTVRELAEQIAAWENGKSRDQLSYRERKRVQNALHQFHLPKMEEHGFVAYDSREGSVSLTPMAAEQDFYVDVLPTRGVPWGLYYLGFSVVMAVSLAAAFEHVAPFSLLPPLEWSVFFATALFASSVGHFYDNYYRMRLGAREKPPEVK